MESLTSKLGIAIVIPVYDDADALARLLRRIGSWRERPDEIAVAAVRQQGGLAEICLQPHCKLLYCDASRGAQLDAGARATTAPLLWFLHADAEPEEESLAAIRAAVAAGASGGCMRFQFQGPRTWFKRVIERLVALRIRCGGIAYGDQGLFAQRAAYLASGGFAHQPLFEEARFVRAIRKHGTFAVLATPIRVSTRRWDKDGWWRRSLHNRWLALRYALGTSAERLAGSYRSSYERTH